MLDGCQDCIKILSAEGIVEYVNSAGQRAFQSADTAKLCGQYWPDLWPAESRSMIENTLHAAKLGCGSTIEVWRPDATNRERWWQVSVSPLKECSSFDADIMTVSRDISEHVRLRDAERRLALEMKHCLRNAYSVASAIVTQSAQDCDAHYEFAEAVSRRLADIALSQTQPLDAGQTSWTLNELVESLLSAHGGRANGVRFAGEVDLMVTGQEATLVALMIGELANNSLKHGALRKQKAVSLVWFNRSRVTIQWREPLVPPLDNSLHAEARSGYSLLRRMADSQRAAFNWEVDNDGLRAELVLPARRRNDRIAS